MSKPIIFVSHAAVDSSIATVFKSDIERNFLGMCELFVSSDLDSLQGGKEWISVIKEKLSQAVISIGLYSPAALSRPWIYTEFGAGWIRDIPTISLCHSGLSKAQLPVPLSHFQALDLIDELHLEHLYKQISEALNCQLPAINYSQESSKYREMTEDARIQREYTSWIGQLIEWNPELEGIFHKQDDIEIMVPSDFEHPFQVFQRDINSKGYLKIEHRGMGMGTRLGPTVSMWSVSPGEKFEQFMKIIGRA